MTPLTPEMIAQIRGDFLRYTALHAIPDSQAAREIAVASSVVSQFRGSKYAGDNERVARALNDWMERHARRKKATLPLEYVTTQVAEDMRRVISMAHATTSIAAIVAPAGCGKSMVLQIMAEQMGGAYIYCTAMLTPRTLLTALARSLGLGKGSAAAATLLADICDKLRGTARPILCDEAHLLRPECLACLRAVHDQAAVAIILAGTDEILNRINDRSGGRGQMASRCLRYNALEHSMNVEGSPSGPDGKRGVGRPLFSKDEIRALFAKSAVKFDAGGLELLWAVACLPDRGTLRTARRLVQHVLERYPEDAVTRDRLRWAAKLLFGLDGGYMVDTVARRHEEAFAACRTA
jgi:DNA transposition AAA+ family ATPase